MFVCLGFAFSGGVFGDLARCPPHDGGVQLYPLLASLSESYLLVPRRGLCAMERPAAGDGEVVMPGMEPKTVVQTMVGIVAAAVIAHVIASARGDGVTGVAAAG
mgnify:CR=1 FL=1